MSLTYRFNRLCALLTFAICVPAVAAAQAQTEPAPRIITAKIKVDDLSMILVPVSINGSGPYDFLLDTGSSKTMLDRKLADELGLAQVSAKTVVGALASTAMGVVHVNSLSVAGATVPGGDVFSTDHPATITGKVRGVLGEDFLKNFDVLIDYRQQVIRFEAPLGSLAQTAAGEHLALQLNGMYHGQATNNRLVVSGHIQELGDKAMLLLLDSGANQLTVFGDLGRGGGQEQQVQAGSFDSWKNTSATTRTVRSLNLGGNSVPDLTAVAFSRRSEVDTDGLVPTSLFRSIFISSRGHFAILNPTFPKSAAQSELVAREAK